MTLKTTIRDIESLKIQGARNIAQEGLKALKTEVSESKQKSLKDLIKETNKKIALLANARPTEPMLRNGLTRVTNNMIMNKNVTEAKMVVRKTINDYLNEMKESKQKVIEIGSKKIRSGDTIMTHCHSSTVTSILIEAAKKKSFNVVCTETRPRYQGRITAKELVKAGVDTTMIVDSCARSVMNGIDLVLVGADAVTSEGNLVNKIGTSQIALVAQEARTHFACACETTKFDPITLYGEEEPIEMRSTKEVWENPPKKLSIFNPAFDVTPADLIDFMITEIGIIHPYEVSGVMRELYE